MTTEASGEIVNLEAENRRLKNQCEIYSIVIKNLLAKYDKIKSSMSFAITRMEMSLKELENDRALFEIAEATAKGLFDKTLPIN